MTKRRSLISVLFIISAICFLMAFAYPMNSAVAETAESSTVTYDFSKDSDADAFTLMQNGGWAITDGKFAPAEAGVQNNAAATKLNQVLDMSKSYNITFDLYVSEPVVEFGLLDSSAENLWGTVRIVRYFMFSGTTPCITLSSYIDNSMGWLGDNTQLGDITKSVKQVKITTDKNGNVSFIIGDTTVHTTTFDGAGAYLIFRATSTETYIDNLKVETITNETVETGSPDDNIIDFNIASDADLFTAAGSGGWNIVSNKYSPVAGWAVSRYNEQIDLTKKTDIILDFSPATDETQFNIALKYSSVEGENDCVGVSIRNNTVWLSNSFGAGLQGEYLHNFVDGLKHTLVISIDNKTITFAIDGEKVIGNNGTTSLSATANSAYLAFQATSTSSYIDNLRFRTDIDFSLTTDAGLFGSAGSGGWVISNETFAPNVGWAVAYNKTAIDTTKKQVIVLDFNADASETQFNIALRSDITEGATSNSVGISIRSTAGAKTVWLDRAFGSGWVAENANLDYIDGKTHQLVMFIEDQKLSFAIDGVALVAYADGNEVTSIEIQSSTMYLAFQATSISSCVDNISFVDSATVTIKGIDETTIKSESAVGKYTLPALTEEGKTLLGYNVNGKFVKTGSEIIVVKDTTVTAIFATFATSSASIRLNEPTGMRFRSYIDNATLTYLGEMNIEYSIGTLIAKSADITEDNTLKVENLTLESSVQKLNIVMTSVGSSLNNEDGNLYFNAAIVSIKPSHYDWSFTARAYITFTVDGETITVYTDGCTRSVSEVAQSALDDENANWENEQKKILNDFIVSGTSVHVSVNGNDGNSGASFSTAVATLEKALTLTDSKKKQ